MPPPTEGGLLGIFVILGIFDFCEYPHKGVVSYTRPAKKRFGFPKEAPASPDLPGVVFLGGLPRPGIPRVGFPLVRLPTFHPRRGNRACKYIRKSLNNFEQTQLFTHERLLS